MRRIPKAVLAFSPLAEEHKASLLRQATAAGIAPDRVVFIPSGPEEGANRARYKLVDIVLDTLPYSGGDTTLAALDMDVPVVTLRGQRHAERISSSILSHLGVPELIASTEEEFVEIACRLAGDAEWRSRIVDSIRKGWQDGALTDMSGYARRLEQAYREALGRFAYKQGGSNDETRRLFQQAVQHHQANEAAEAEKYYREVLASQPDHAPAWFLYGRLHEQSGRQQQAIEHWQQAIAASDAYLDAHLAVGNAWLAQGRLEEAYKEFERAYRLSPGNNDALNGMGLALSRAGKLRTALPLLNQVARAEPGRISAWINLARVCEQLGETGAAFHAWRSVLGLEPGHAEARGRSEQLGRILMQQRRAREGTAG